jgi:hypothetical protein
MSKTPVQRYWDRVARVPCLISGGPAEIAHCHGGSMVPLMGPHAKGKKLARFDWLVLPLAPHYHRAEYRTGLDRDVKAWERMHGSQVMWIGQLIANLGVDVWAMAGIVPPSPTNVRWVSPAELEVLYPGPRSS